VTAVWLIPLLAVFTFIAVAVARLVYCHGQGGRHRLHRPGRVRSRVQHLIRRKYP
jgi:hypothetical protein